AFSARLRIRQVSVAAMKLMNSSPPHGEFILHVTDGIAFPVFVRYCPHFGSPRKTVHGFALLKQI
ncbi:hypothetical protein, partial [Duodenibacillus massiliensis]|uniref:hypothetical protein n=1 Tax=Duodenibacillus massiliensis TaxID=1852381 RepID=UPI00307DF981